MKKTVLIAFLFSFVVKGVSQSTNLNSPLPEDSSIRKGVLNNGMTYYLHATDVTKGVASYYIIQNVGSILEEDNQQGLAHFLEHMAFNGTESFEGKELLNKMQKHGLVFGKDINAYTSFDETVYNINNIPTTPELVETGLTALHDWSNYLLLTDEEIDAERGVIKEEWRSRQSGGMRVLQKTIGTAANNSKYAKRLPIGLMDVVENFEYKALRDFYHNWYRTDLQAIAIIGDFNVDEMEAKIKTKFSKIQAVKDGPKRYDVVIDDNEELLYEMATDKEVATSNIKFNIRHPKGAADKTIGSLKENILNEMVSSILSNRFKEITQQPDAPFIYVRASYSKDNLARNHKSFSLTLVPKPNQQKEAFELAMTEINRAVKFGFTKAEIERTKAEFSNYYENEISKLNDRSHQRIIGVIKDNYLDDATMTDVAKEYEIVKTFFNQLTQNDLLVQIQKMYTKKNRSLIVTGVEGNKNLSKNDALAIINTIENSKSLQPYEEEEATKNLMSGVEVTSGKITSNKQNKAVGAKEFVLSNGVKVYYKFANKNKNEVILNAVSDGGLSLVNDQDLPSASMLGNVVQMSGIGEFSATELQKVLAGKSAQTSVRLSNISESVSGKSTTKDVETLLQLTNLHFTKPRFDEKAYQVLVQNIDNFLIRKSQDIGSKMKDSVAVTLYGKNNPKERLLDKEFVADLSLDKMKSIYKSRFGNASDFSFFIIGDVNEEVLKPLLEKYIASIPTTNVLENWKDNTSEWLSKKIDKDIYLPMEDPKATVRISIQKDMNYNLKDYYVVKTLGDILQLRYTQSLREEQGGTYGAGVYAGLSKKPQQKASISVYFDCNPDLADKLVATVHEEMNKIKNGEIQQNDLDKTLTSYLKEREEAKNYNSYDVSLLKNFYLEGYNMSDSENFEQIIKSITMKDVQKMMANILNNSESYEIVFKPEK